MYYLLAFVVTLLVGASCAQSVAQQCLTEQIRNNQFNANFNNQNRAPEEITMAAFDSICRNYESYVNCFTTRLPFSNNPADRFLQLVFAPGEMERAYRGLCTLDLERLREDIRCLLSTPEVRRCYNNFNQGVNQVVNLQNQNQLPRITLEELACNVSVARYRCETAVYAFCDERAGRIMRDFFYAGITDECRMATGVRSRYVDIFNSGSAIYSQGNLVIFLATLLMFLLSRFNVS